MGYGNLILRGDISGIMSYSVNFTRDNVLLNNVSAKLYLRAAYFGFEFGPFIRLGDVLETPDAGIICYVTRHFNQIPIWFTGFEVNWQITRPPRLIGGLEMPLIYKAVEPMAAPDFFWTTFKAKAGIAITFF